MQGVPQSMNTHSDTAYGPSEKALKNRLLKCLNTISYYDI